MLQKIVKKKKFNKVTKCYKRIFFYINFQKIFQKIQEMQKMTIKNAIQHEKVY